MLAGMFDKLKKMGEGLRDDAVRLKNKQLMEACTAGCAIIASADGNFDQDERGAVSRMCAELGLDDEEFLPAT